MTKRAALDKFASMPRITGYGIRDQVTRRESDELVIVEYDNDHQTDVYLVASPFAHLYYQVAKVDGEWRCSASEEAVKAECIHKALAFKHAPERKARMAARRTSASFGRMVEAYGRLDDAWRAMSIDERRIAVLR